MIERQITGIKTSTYMPFSIYVQVRIWSLKIRISTYILLSFSLSHCAVQNKKDYKND